MTFSIVAYDPNDEAWGVGVASKFLAVGALVSWARAGAGAVATQSFCKVGFGPDGLAMMADDKSAQETLKFLLANDPGSSLRQVGIVDARGGSAAHTGADCFDWKGHIIGEGFTCQGNILTGGDVLDSMAQTFISASGELADRLVTALLAGDAAGGDKRGRQGAAVVVVKAGGGYGGDTDRYLDLRVDDDPQPVQKLERLVGLHHLFFGKPQPQDQLPITADIARELQTFMRGQGYFLAEADGVWDDNAKKSFWAMVGSENLEERWNLDRDTDVIDRLALDYLREQFGHG